MLCMHQIIPNRYIHPSGGFYSWLFAPDRGGNRTTKLCLGTYLIPFDLTIKHELGSVRVMLGLKVTQSRLDEES